MFDVRIVDDDGEGVSGVRVALSWTNPLRGMADEVTDEDGHAEFDGYDDGEVKVFLNGTEHGTYKYEDGGSITLTH